MSRDVYVDARFAQKPGIHWKTGVKQGVQRFDYNTITASTKSDTKYEFYLPNTNPVAFGAETGFVINGIFECKSEATNADTNPQWDVVPLADYTKVVLQPNWFDHLVKSVDVYYNNLPVNPHNVPNVVDPLLNTYLYSVMDKSVKKVLCPEACNPGNGVPTKVDGWSATAESEWHKYSKTIFNNRNVIFRYVPLLTFPFHQDANYIGMDASTALPMEQIGKLKVNIRLHSDSSMLFKKSAGNTKSYRFRITGIELVVLDATLSNAFERSFNQTKRVLNFPGVTKLGSVENFNKGVNTARFRFPDIPYPEGIFIMAINKKSAGGDYKYSEATATTGSLFKNHNIEEVEVKFGNNVLANKVPNLGTLNNHVVEIKQYMDHMTSPPFGIAQNLDMVTLESIKEGSKNGLFPHVYINLCPSGKDTRIVPVTDDGSSINKGGDMQIDIKFYSEGAPDEAVFVFYAFYTDINMKLDLVNKAFMNEYTIKN